MRLVDADFANIFLNIEACEQIKRMQTVDAVPVVRCKDCKYYFRKDMPNGTGWCTAVDVSSFDKHFCSYGEKRYE